MPKHTIIRLTDDELDTIVAALSARGLTKSEVARQAALKTCVTKRFPEIKKSRQTRTRSISFVMSESLKEEFSALCKEHKTSMSAVIRHYLMNPQDLFTKKGKNYSKNRSRHLRNDNDLYQTPYSMTRRLLEKEQLEGSVLEPACGDGAIVHVLKEFGYQPTAYDIEQDFLKETRNFGSVITNPPYSLAAEFISKCKQVAEHRFYLLLPLSYLHGKSRYDTFYSDSKFGLRKIYIFTRNPMFEQTIREDGKYKTGMQIYAWYIFENGYNGEPVMDWIDNHEDVVRK